MNRPTTERAPGPDDPSGEARFGFDLPDEAWLERLRTAAAPCRGQRLGQYELLGEIRRGAQGVVLRARQPGTGRIVALKRLLHGSLSTPEQRIRFERECEAACALNHPNIVAVYGFEYVDDQPVVAMEWVQGLPIDRWARCGKDGPHQPPAVVLDVFLKVCEALQHAHQRGVIHRDLKPGNILITQASGDGLTHEPKVLDFGLAKRIEHSATSSAPLTASRDFMGTPAYASPEQIRGEHQRVDTRSDVYSLGVVLYELLTGRLPFDPNQGVAALFDSIRTAEPPPPSRICPDVDADLDAIVRKAMSKEPSQRYASVDALAADIRRFRRYEPVEARRAQRGYAVRMFVRRHRTALATVAAFVLTLAASAISVGVMYVRQAAVLQQVERARNDETAARLDAQRIQGVLGRLLMHVAEVGAGADASVRRDMLGEARQMVDSELRDAPAAQAEALSAIGQTYQQLALYDEAEACLKRALQLTIELADERSLATAAALDRLGEAQQARSHYADAENNFRKALLLRQSMLAGDDPAIAESLHNLGNALSNRERFTEALHAYGAALELRRRVLGECRRETIRSIQGVGVAYANLGDLETAEAYLREALDLAREALGPEDADTIATDVALGKVLFARGDLDGAEELLRRGLAAYRVQFGDRHDAVAWAAHRLGTVLHARGEWDEAEPLLREARETYRLVLGEDDPFVGFVCESLAELLDDAGRGAEAAAMHAEAERIRDLSRLPREPE